MEVRTVLTSYPFLMLDKISQLKLTLDRLQKEGIKEVELTLDRLQKEGIKEVELTG